VRACVSACVRVCVCVCVCAFQSEAGKQECQLRLAIACMLIRNGAYVDVENRKGRNPLLYGVPPVNEGVKRFIKHK